MNYEIYGVLAGAYLRSDDRRAYLTHAVVDGAILCKRVKDESLCDDTCSPSYRRNEGTPTCQPCARKLAKLLKGTAKP